MKHPFRSHSGSRALVRVAILALFSCSSLVAQYAITGSSWISGSGSTDYGAGVVIKSDGKLVVAANLGDAAPGGLSPVLLNGATASSGGAVLLVSPDGETVLSVTRLAGEVLDVSLDADENIHVAAGADGIVKLDPTATSVVWTAANGGYCRRLDVTPGGTVVGLSSTGSNTGFWYLHDASGSELGSFPGLHFTQDVAIKGDGSKVYLIGFKNNNSGCNPVQVAYLRCLDTTGGELWMNYDWPGTWLDNCDGDGWDNLMADTRGYRVVFGRDGLIYGAFEAAGGNHIFSRVPTRSSDPNRNSDPSIDGINLKTSISIVGGDMWFEFWNTQSQHKTFVGRYDPDTGGYIRGQQLCTRYYGGSSPVGNTLRVAKGSLAVDESGTVYLGGESASGLPFNPTHSNSSQTYTAGPGEYELNPFPMTAANNVYSGGAYLIVLSSDFTKRLYCTRLSAGSTQGVDGRTLPGKSAPSVAWVGNVAELNMDWKDGYHKPTGTNAKERVLHTVNPFQATRAGGTMDGFLAVIGQGGLSPVPTLHVEHLGLSSELRFGFQSETGFDYQLRSSPSLAVPVESWSPVGSPLSGDDTWKIQDEPVPATDPMFYVIERN